MFAMFSRKKYLIEASSVVGRKCIRRSTRCTVRHRLPIRQSAVMPGRRHWVGPRPEKQACYHSEAGFAAYPSADAASVRPMPRLHSTASRRQAGRAAAAPRRLSRSSRVVFGFLGANAGRRSRRRAGGGARFSSFVHRPRLPTATPGTSPPPATF